jgi:SNF2 family DNA or RNA helicase
MRIEAHLAKQAGVNVGIEVRFFKTQRDRAESLRKLVTASRFAGGTDLDDLGIRFRYPLSVDKCREMRVQWGTDVKVHRDLSNWYRKASVEHTQQVARTAQTDAKLTNVPTLYPELNEYLFGDQRVTAAWMANAYRGGGLLADEVGTGKTVGVIGGLVEADINGPTLVVCPKISVKAVWGREFAKHCPDVPVYLCRGSRKSREKAIAAFLADARSFKVLVIVSEMLRVRALVQRGRIEEFFGYEYPDLFDITWACCVVDESHRLLGAMDVVRGNLASEGLRALRFTADRLKLAVSATPFGKGGRVEAMFGTLHWLWPDEFPGKWAWLEKYFEVTTQRVFVRGGGGETKMVKRVGNVLNEESFWAELGPRVLRRTMEEVSPAHRGLKHFYEVLCEMDPKQRVQYTKFSEDAELAVDGGVITTVGVLDYMTRCRQFANGHLRKEGGRVVYTGESGKIDQLLAHLEQLEPNRKVVIGSQYNEFLDVVEERLLKEGYYNEYVGHAGTHPLGGMVRLDGKTSEAKRDAYMHAFQTDPTVKIFLINSQAGGVSITLDAADELHALDEMYPPEANTQFYGRIFRRGRVHHVFYYLYRSLGTIDEAIGTSVAEGHQHQARILDGRRGLEYVRELAQYNEDQGATGLVAFVGGKTHKIRKCRGCGVARNQWHVGYCTWEGDY